IELKLSPRWGLTFTIDYFYQSAGRAGIILKMLKYIKMKPHLRKTNLKPKSPNLVTLQYEKI
ncbi:MAG TPA: hypothetical protein PKW62_11765, partial [Chitinophagaceae bacterium]|nr:hypothetical protein [Chitinophagaceae bacterium]